MSMLITKIVLSIAVLFFAYITYAVYRMLWEAKVDPHLALPTWYQWIAAGLMLLLPPASCIAAAYYLYSL